MTENQELKGLADKWPSAFVAREKLELFTGGIISARTMANYDCKGMGIKDRIRVGRKVAYPVSAVIEWLEARTEVAS